MKDISLILLCFTLLTSFKSDPFEIDPTGIYELPHKTKKNGDVYGYTGRILVKRLDRNRIVLDLSINKGAPSYNSGTLFDTLDYHSPVAVFANSKWDKSCRITFTFDTTGVEVNEETDDFNNGCGFGHAVVAQGFFRKISEDESQWDQKKE